MISITALTPSGRAESTPGVSRNVGQYVSYVLAIENEYLLPAFDPLAATPPGNGVMTPGVYPLAASARAAAPSAESRSLPSSQRFPPISPSW